MQSDAGHLPGFLAIAITLRSKMNETIACLPGLSPIENKELCGRASARGVDENWSNLDR